MINTQSDICEQNKDNQKQSLRGEAQKGHGVKEAKAEFKKIFNKLAYRHSPYDVFSDFVNMSAIAMSNSMVFDRGREDDYMRIIKKYTKDEINMFPSLYAHVVMGLEAGFCDFLGEIFMELELGNARAGQFFTPYHLSKLMSQISFDGQVSDKGYLTVSEPACGCGGMIIALAETMLQRDINPQQALYAECVDIDKTVAMACYVQLSLLHIPAKIIVGNSLTLEARDIFYTPAYTMGFWNVKLTKKRINESEIIVKDLPILTNQAIDTVEELKEKPIVVNKLETKIVQFDLFG